ncbi:MAG TPA: TAXI family TRAP transporter solute-binding subunit [Methylomirabilota bacterium]|nr:TAXI family TRAP transporter solute-binding subunit [Methylomirabilota bacterium]
MALVLAALVGCARGPDEAALRQEVQDKLTKQVKDGLFELASLGRKGSAPLPSGEQGTKRLVVYYNATLRFRQDYDFGGWEKLSPASLGYALGATEKGLFGIKPQNRAGDVLYAYGTSTYEWSGDAWKSVAPAGGAVTAAPDAENTAPPSRSKQLIDKLAAMINLPPPGTDPGQEEVIADELNRATENIERRLARRQHVYTFASGPPGGEYARFGAALVASVKKKVRPGVAVRHLETEGSVQNAWLLSRGEADYAILQADVAAEAVAGGGPFARGGPLTTLRAVASLFPEAVHVVVPAASPIGNVEDLRGKRVDIGPPGSGTRHSAVAVLGAHGLKVGDLGQASERGREEAVRRLVGGQLDAFFTTIAPPARDLQQLAARKGMKLLALPGRSVNRLVAENPGLVAMTLPPNTYPGQGEPIATVATAALLVATSDAPDAEVEKMLGVVFAGADLAAAGSAEGVKASKDSALRGITIPLHPGTSRFFGPGRS